MPPVRYTVGLIGALTLAWVLWSWHFTPLLLALGVASILFAYYLSRRMDLLEGGPDPVMLPRLVAYLPWLFLEIVKSNLDVAARILSPRLPIAPRIIRVHAGQRGDVGRVIYANSITLTPGTVTVDTDGDILTIHALTAGAAEGVESGEMDRRVTRLEGREAR